MKYKSLAAVAAAFAVATLIVGPATSAVAKTDVSHALTASAATVTATAGAKPDQLYAEAGAFGENRLVRLDAQPLAGTSALVQRDEESAPLNLWALVVAGFAVMGSLAFRRSPNK